MTQTENLTPAAWDQRAGESNRAYSAFCAYRDMGVRSLRELLKRFQQASNGTQTPPTTRWTTLSTWSTRYNWVERCAIWDTEQKQLAEIRAATDARNAIHAAREVRRGFINALGDQLAKTINDLEQKQTLLSANTGLLNYFTRALETYLEQSRREYNDMPTERRDLTTKGNELPASRNVILDGITDDEIDRILTQAVTGRSVPPEELYQQFNGG